MSAHDTIEVNVIEGERFDVTMVEGEVIDVNVIDGDQFEVQVYEMGLPGLTGAPGISGGVYAFDQNVPSDTWVIAHNLGFRPNVTTTDTLDRVIEGEPVYDSLNQLTVLFATPQTGHAYLT